ncbi:MAG: hypothetical protein K2K60_05120 [Clostridia bacterium]|nr:hypothetical protein [Clostridia bacterium]
MFFYIYIIIFVLVFLIALCGVLFYQSSKNKANGNEQFDINKKILEYLQTQEFKVSKIFYITDSHTFNKDNSYKKMIIADNENKKICFIDYILKNYYIIGFEEFLNYELYENGGMVTNGGTIGSLGIGVFGAETIGNCKDLKLIIRIKSLTTPQVAYEIISNYMAGIGLNKSAPLYRVCISSLQEVISFFEVIKNDNLQNSTVANV